LSELKPVQNKELEESFAQLPQEKAVPERLLRSQQALVRSETAENEEDIEMGMMKSGIDYIIVHYVLTTYADEGGDAPEEEEDTNALDLADPVDIMSKVSPNFFELLVGR
jgi:cytoskeleton-associated protein 5